MTVKFYRKFEKSVEFSTGMMTARDQKPKVVKGNLGNQDRSVVLHIKRRDI